MPTKSNKTDWNFDNSYSTLPDKMFRQQLPVSVEEPELFIFNEILAEDLGLDFLSENKKESTLLFSGNKIPEGAKPLAQAYAGHQFGHFTMLGDGRAVLLGEHISPKNKRYDIQLKGSGQTPFSRRGDGRATLYSMLREYLISEAMHHLGIPSSRSLAVVKTGEPVYREKINEGAVLTRISSSHIRVGTFEYLRQFGTTEELKTFTEYVINRHYPEIKEADNPPLELVGKVMEKQIDLIVNWMRVGFIHGVMNTDNASIAGETFDYGPCAFLNKYKPSTVFSSIDTYGRYAFGNQPKIAHWNMSVFAGALLPIIHESQDEAIELAKAALNKFPSLFAEKWYAILFNKLGISNPLSSDKKMADDLLELMEKHEADYTNLFIALRYGKENDDAIFQSEEFINWRLKWENRIEKNSAFELMEKSNPTFIPRNHLVEEALENAVNGNREPFEKMLSNISNPYDYTSEESGFQLVPEEHDAAYQTFCGT